MNKPIDEEWFSNATNIALWTLQIVTSTAFLLAGSAKLADNPMMVETFEYVGIGQWFRYVAGLIEIASAVALLIPRVTPIAAALLSCAMIGAVVAYLTVVGGSPVPALVLLCFSGIILLGRFQAIETGLRNLTSVVKAIRADATMSPERRAAMLNGTIHMQPSLNA